jgi:hypothetical protein
MITGKRTGGICPNTAAVVPDGNHRHEVKNLVAGIGRGFLQPVKAAGEDGTEGDTAESEQAFNSRIEDGIQSTVVAELRRRIVRRPSAAR